MCGLTTRERQTAASTAPMHNARPWRRGHAPQPRSGAPKAQGLTATIAVAAPSNVPSFALKSTGVEGPIGTSDTLEIYTSLTDVTSARDCLAHARAMRDCLRSLADDILMRGRDYASPPEHQPQVRFTGHHSEAMGNRAPSRSTRLARRPTHPPHARPIVAPPLPKRSDELQAGAVTQGLPQRPL